MVWHVERERAAERKEERREKKDRGEIPGCISRREEKFHESIQELPFPSILCHAMKEFNFVHLMIIKTSLKEVINKQLKKNTGKMKSMK